ncbi:lysophospholipase [Rhodococcus sp. KBS0724]|uniref:alpha/beta hydrolase family protein n=1 Tax=Rhodococcus sp. KBS0724 TaxID=1179674 RepID=UPI00110F0D0F|nr:alpha/beta hydrolase [Rhodococcus sp. KBS0724]TSD40251.1 lysophospholipase [Rhodococcus sp. KBS0724]
MTTGTRTALVDKFSYPLDIGMPDTDIKATKAALRQFTLHRLHAYGIEIGDGLRLMELAAENNSWSRSATSLADQILARAEDPELPKTVQGQAALFARASALQRISQVMDVENTPERRATYLAAADNFTRARAHDSRYEHVVIDTAGGPVTAWVITPNTAGPHPVALVHGGVDGWSMDWEGTALPLVEEGFLTVILDGPGQGETRFVYEHYLTPDWLDSYKQVCEYLLIRAAGMPVTAVGNSMAGALVILIASKYPIFAAVCSNGPVISMASTLVRHSYAKKLSTFCGTNPPDKQVRAVFESMELSVDRIQLTCPYLLLQGDSDPMVSLADGERLLKQVPAADKQMALFERGEHVINRYPADKHHITRTWMRDRVDRALLAASTPRM